MTKKEENVDALNKLNQQVDDVNIEQEKVGDISPEQADEMAEIQELISAEKLDIETSFNIIINAVQSSYDKEHFNDLDRYLISKSLMAFKEKIDAGEDILIRMS